MRAVTSKKWICTGMIAPPVSATQSIVRAILVSVGPKSIGSTFRVKDDWNAPKKIRQDTILREGATLAQIAGYSLLIDRSVKLLETGAIQYLKRNSNRYISAALKKFQNNQALFLVLLSCLSNFMAESFSRKLAPRDIWDQSSNNSACSGPKQKDDDDDEDDDHSNRSTSLLASKAVSSAPLKPLTFAQQPLFQTRPVSPFRFPLIVSSLSTSTSGRPSFSL